MHLEKHLEHTLVMRLAAIADQDNREVYSEKAAFEERIRVATAPHRSRYEAGLAACEQAFERAEACLAICQVEELKLHRRECQLPSDSYGEVRDAQAAFHWNAWTNYVQLRQWHGAETRQMESEHAMLAAHASQEMASAEAIVQRLQAKHRSDAEALQRRCDQILTSAKVEHDRVDAMLRACKGELFGCREELRDERA